MTKVRMNTLYAGPNGTCHPGACIDLPANEAAALVAGRYADLADPAAEKKAKEESAAPAEPEKAEAEVEETADKNPNYRATQRRGRA